MVAEGYEFDGGAGTAEPPAVFGVTVDFDDEAAGFVVGLAARVAGVVVSGHVQVVGMPAPHDGQLPNVGGRQPWQRWQCKWSQQQANMTTGPWLVSA